jgi:hypothetical protein
LVDEATIAAIADSIEAINALPSATQLAVRATFNDAYNFQMQIMLPFCFIALAATALLWEKKLRRAKDVRGY